MHSSLATHAVELRQLCHHFGVLRLELFGSAARDTIEPRDLDFLVEFEPLAQGERASAYLGLLAALEELFGRPVDLVMTNAIRNQRFLRAIEGERTPIYAA